MKYPIILASLLSSTAFAVSPSSQPGDLVIRNGGGSSNMGSASLPKSAASAASAQAPAVGVITSGSGGLATSAWASDPANAPSNQSVGTGAGQPNAASSASASHSDASSAPSGVTTESEGGINDTAASNSFPEQLPEASAPGTERLPASSDSSSILLSAPDRVRPNMAELMKKANIDSDAAGMLIYGVIGSNTDYRNWRLIMASPNPVEAARKATALMYNTISSQNPNAVKVPFGTEDEKVTEFAREGNYQIQKISKKNGSSYYQLMLVDKDGYILTTATQGYYFGFDSSVIKNLRAKADAAGIKVDNWPAASEAPSAPIAAPSTVVATKQETPPATKNGTTIANFYKQLLGRAGSAQEIAIWEKQVSDKHLTAEKLAEGFIGSGEFAGRWASASTSEKVRILYVGLLGREPDPSGKASFEAKVEAGASAKEISDDLLSSAEFRGRENSLLD